MEMIETKISESLKNTIGQMKNGQMQKQNCMVYKCPVCRDTGIELYIADDGHEYARNCKCGLWQRERMNRMLSFADIPEAFAGLRLDSFDTSIYDMANSRKIADMNMQIANYWLDDFEKMKDRGMGLYMYSAVKGSGKTRFAVSLANEVIERYAVGVKFATSVQILNEIKASWNSDSQMTEHRLLDELTEVEALVIDDFGIEVPKDWSMERFYQIVNSRYIHKKITIYTSNSALEDLLYDDRITNRIEENTYQLRFPSESVRKLLRERHQAELVKMMKGGVE